MSHADTLIARLGLAKRRTAEVQDLYSRPIPPRMVPVLPKVDAPQRSQPEVTPQPEREAA